MNITMKQGYLYFGTTSATCTLAIPYPSTAPQTTNFSWKSNTAADGSTVGQQFGRAKNEIKLTWDIMDTSIWNTICNWIISNGNTFWCNYYNIHKGAWETRQYYTLGFSATPYRQGGTYSDNKGVPTYLTNCTISLEDLGG